MQINDELLADARALVKALETRDGAGAAQVLDRLLRAREAALYQEIGRLTRDLHEAINRFSQDSRLASLAQREWPDAGARLAHVVEMTAQAAHRTLEAVEQGLPLSKGLVERSARLREAWTRFLERRMAPDEFRGLTREIDEFLAAVGRDAEGLHRHLSEVLVAQDYQDLTGQIIRQAIQIGREMEERLVSMLRMLGLRHPAPDTAADPVALAGPQVPGREAPGVVRGQDEVDELLSSLGF